MVIRSWSGVSEWRVALLLCAAALAALVAALAAPAGAAAQGEGKKVLLYTGTTGFRHSDGINGGRPILQAKLQELGYGVETEDCNGNGGGSNNCDNVNKNPRIFTATNLAQYDAVVLLNTSWSQGTVNPGPLFNVDQRAALIGYVQNGGGIAGMHNATDMGAGTSVWDWWDGGANSVVGTTMPGHSANSTTANLATVQVEDNNHLATRELPDTWPLGDEHYNYARNVRGGHHVLANFDERTYNPGSNGMGQDHPITWCKLYDGDSVNDGTSTPKSYSDGRTWVTGMGHNGVRYSENGGDNNMVKMMVGGIRWVAGEGRKSDCSGTVWSSFTREVLVADARGPIGIDVAKDGKVYWSEIGPNPGLNSQGYVMMYDPSKPAGSNKTQVATILTRADHGNSEDGVLGMSLQPGFDLADPAKRNLFVYYSPRPGAGDNWPTSGNAQTVGYNVISRFTLNAEGTEFVPGSERMVLKVPKAKISGSPQGFPGGPSDSGPGHVGGAGLDFDSAGNLYLGVGDDVSPNAGVHDRYPPMDYRAAERWDARKTSANSADLRGKIVRITPKQGEIPAGTDPGVDATYTIPSGNMFAPGTPNTRPEIYAMGFRQPFTVHTDPANPGIVGMGDYCHDNQGNNSTRGPAGVCEWNLISKPGNFGWPYCVGDNSAINSSFRWNYAANQSTGQRYDCSLASMPSDLNYAPSGQTPAPPTFQGLENLPGPVVPATIWRKYPSAEGGQNAMDFGDLSAGNMQPITGPIYRYDQSAAGPGAFPRYYDGAWFINNRGADNGFWKEVRLRQDNNEMLRVNNWLPYNAGATNGAQNSSLVIGTQFGPDGSLYMARFPVGCCRNTTSPTAQTQIVKISFNVQDECLTDTSAPTASHQVTGQAYPGEPDTYVNAATLRLTASDVGCAGVESVEYRVNGEAEWRPYTDAVNFDEADEYSIEYRVTDRKDNVSAVKTASFEVLEIDDETAPTTNAAAAGNQDQRDHFIGSTTLTLTATDNEAGSGVDKIEYRVNGGAYTTYASPVLFHAPGLYEIDYRATDKVQNTSEVKRITFRVLSGDGCTQSRSDEFDGAALGSQWIRHTRNGGTPTTGPLGPSVSGGKLNLPTHNLELDGNAATTALGPVNFIGQDLPSLGENWSVETQFTVQFTGGWQNAGLILWQADNNFVRSTLTHSLNAGNVYVEQSKDNPTSAEGQRVQAQGNVTIAPDKSQPITIKMRYTRSNGANSVVGQYQIVAPASAATPDWVNFPATNGVWTSPGGLDLNPAGGLRRDSANSRVGIIAQSNFPGTAGTHAYNGTPANVVVDYFRVTPDVIDCETAAPTTTAALDPAAPGAGGTYQGAVKVGLTATDSGAGAAGVEKTEYRVTTNGTTGTWQALANSTGADPFVSQVNVATEGSHTVEFRSTDKAANVETTKTVSFSIELPECAYSDDFDGTALNTVRWPLVTNPAANPVSVTGGSLRLPILGEIDGTATGPLSFVAQQVPAGTSWTAEAKLTAAFGTSWQQAGLLLRQSDTNFVKVVFSRNPSGGRFFQIAADNPPNNTRSIGAQNAVPSDFPTTAWVRMVRNGNTITGAYSSDGTTWTQITGANNSHAVNTTPAREGDGVRIGVYAGSDIDGTFESTAAFDSFKFTPDDCPTGADQAAPTTTATTAPAAPNGGNGWFTADVNVSLTGNDGPNGSGVEKTEYRVGGGAFATYSAPVAVTAAGTHTVEFRSTDKAGNVEATKSLTVKVDKAAPETTGTIAPAVPGNDPATLTLVATDPVSGVAKSEYQVTQSSPFGAFGAPSLSSALEWVEYNSAAKPVFSAPGVYSIEYRSIDSAGNVEAIKTVGFTITAPNNDTLAPVTTGTLDPSSPGAGRTYAVPVTVKFSATDPAPAGGQPETFEVDAFGDVWDTTALSIANGDRITWNFPAEEHFPHDVWVIAPGGNPLPGSPDRVQVTSGVVMPGGPSVSKTFTQNGAWTFYCSLHATYSDGEWSGMAGTINVAAPEVPDAPTGVDYTEYRVKTGATQGDWVRAANTGNASPFASQVTVSAEGQHTVEYRSVDEAGNAEAAKTVEFGIDIPDPGFPVIQAFADPTSGTAPLLVRFSATGFDPDGGQLSYKWEFANGDFLGRVVERTFTQPGTYTAKVTATDDEGDKTTQEVTVTVRAPGVEPPTVEAAASVTSLQAGSSVQFTATGTDPDGPANNLTYSWDFGDGGSSYFQSPSHEYRLPGTYNATVTAKDPSGATATKTIVITVTDPPGNQVPFATIGADPNAGTAPLKIEFTSQVGDADGDTLTYEWDFDDGSAKSTAPTATHTFTSAGIYVVKLKVSDGRGGVTTVAKSITVGNPPANQAPSVQVTADPKSGTSPLTVQFSSQVSDPEGQGLLLVWDFGDGGFGGGLDATHTYTAPGTYTAKLTATDPGGLSTSATVQIVVTAPQGANNNNGGGGADDKSQSVAPSVNAWFGVGKPAKTTVATFTRTGLSVQVTCTEAMTGTATLTLSAKLRKQLGLKSATLASSAVKCAGAGSKTVKLKPSKAVQRALKKAKGSVKLTLGVSLRANGEASKKATRAVTLASR